MHTNNAHASPSTSRKRGFHVRAFQPYSVVLPAPLQPPFPFDYSAGKDRLYDQELRLALRRIHSEDIAPLPQLAQSVATTPLALLKQLPLSLLAALVLRNIAHLPRGSHRPAELAEIPAKRLRRDETVAACEELDETARERVETAFCHQLITAGIEDPQGPAGTAAVAALLGLLTAGDEEEGGRFMAAEREELARIRGEGRETAVTQFCRAFASETATALLLRFLRQVSQDGANDA